MANLNFKSSGKDISCSINQLVIAGWTGRNKEAVEHHIEELEKLGVASVIELVRQGGPNQKP